MPACEAVCVCRRFCLKAQRWVDGLRAFLFASMLTYNFASASESLAQHGVLGGGSLSYAK